MLNRYLNIIKLQRYISDRRIPQMVYAKLVGVPYPQLQAFLASDYPCECKFAERLAEPLGVTAEDILLPKGMGIRLVAPRGTNEDYVRLFTT